MVTTLLLHTKRNTGYCWNNKQNIKSVCFETLDLVWDCDHSVRFIKFFKMLHLAHRLLMNKLGIKVIEIFNLKWTVKGANFPSWKICMLGKLVILNFWVWRVVCLLSPHLSCERLQTGLGCPQVPWLPGASGSAVWPITVLLNTIFLQK